MSEEVYLCKDCVHSFLSVPHKIGTLGGRVGVGDWMYKCKKTHKPEKTIINVVSGPEKQKESYKSCNTERGNWRGCSNEGKNWYPKKKEDMFRYLAKENSTVIGDSDDDQVAMGPA